MLNPIKSTKLLGRNFNGLNSVVHLKSMRRLPFIKESTAPSLVKKGFDAWQYDLDITNNKQIINKILMIIQFKFIKFVTATYEVCEII